MNPLTKRLRVSDTWLAERRLTETKEGWDRQIRWKSPRELERVSKEDRRGNE